MSNKSPAFTERGVNPVRVESLLIELAQLEQSLLASALATEQPTAAALASTAPFCFDSMPFESWLQWVFVPRMRQVLREGLPLAVPCSIAPLAEYQWQNRPEETRDLTARLVQFDAAINRHFGFTQPE